MSNKNKRELVTQIAEYERRHEEEKIRYFIPTRPQELFVRSKNKEKLFLGANRTGKSMQGIIEDISWCLGYRPYLKKTDPDYLTPIKPPVHGLITTESLGSEGSANKIITPLLHDFVPKPEFEFIKGNPKKNQQGVEVNWKFKNGSTLTIMSYEQGSDKYEGHKYHFWHADEPPPRDIYTAVSRGLTDYNGYTWFTMTPLKEPWVYRDLYQNPRVFSITIGIRENLKHKRDWYGKQVETGGLEEEAIRSFETKLRSGGTEEGEIKARLTGEFRFLSGRVIENFDPNIHCIPPFDIPKDWARYEAIDPHPQKPWCITFMAVAPDNTCYVYKVSYIKAKLEEIIEHIKIVRDGIKPKWTIIDPAAKQDAPVSGTTLIDNIYEMSNGEIKPQASSKDKDRGIQLIRTACHHDKGIKPKLYIFNTEYKAITQLRDWVWVGTEGKEIAQKVDDDFPENLYRLLIENPIYIFHQTNKEYLKKRRQIKGIGS